MKKVLALGLAIVMMVGMTVTAFASFGAGPFVNSHDEGRFPILNNEYVVKQYASYYEAGRTKLDIVLDGDTCTIPGQGLFIFQGIEVTGRTIVDRMLVQGTEYTVKATSDGLVITLTDLDLAAGEYTLLFNFPSAYAVADIAIGAAVEAPAEEPAE